MKQKSKKQNKKIRKQQQKDQHQQQKIWPTFFPISRRFWSFNH